MLNEIWLFLVQREGKVTTPSIQLISLAKSLSATIKAVLIGTENVKTDEINKLGINTLHFIKNSGLENYSCSAYTKLLTDFVKDNNVKVMLFPNNSMIKDFLPRVSVKTGAGIAMDCVNLELQGEDSFIATRPLYAGKALAKVKVNSEIEFYSIRPNTFSVPESADFETEIVSMEMDEIDTSSRVTEVLKKSDKVDLTEAEIIISGGRGLKGPENFAMLEELAELINGAVGASRPVCDSGWRPHSDQVGQTGKTVSPKLYIAVGISGAIQHQAGMKSSKYIVAINKDPDAPIFQIADYGIVGDAFEIVPAMIKELKAGGS